MASDFKRQQLSTNVVAYPSAPFELDDTWQKWLGTLQTNTLREANFILLAVEPSSKPLEFDDESKRLEAQASRYLEAMMLCGLPAYVHGMVLSGGIGEETRIRQVKPLGLFRHHNNASPTVIDSMHLDRAVETAVGLERVRSRAMDFRRLNLGLQSWHRACLAMYYHDRLHLFARAFQALLRPDQGRTTAQFKSRGLLMIGRSDRNATRLCQIYELRCAAEHLNEWELVDSLENVPAKSREAVVTQRAFEIEAIASAALTHVLRTPALLEHFASDDLIERFWHLSEEERRMHWGPPIDIEEILDTRYVTRRLRRRLEKYGVEPPDGYEEW